MYFSKNSNYVLKKASWISPSSYFLKYLKAPQARFGTKIPQEDPTKPPLRINIPKESNTCEPDFSKHLHDSANGNTKKCLNAPRSKSVVSRANFSVNLPHKSESASHLSGLTKTAFVADRNFTEPQTKVPDGVPYYVNSEVSNNQNTILDTIFLDKKDHKFHYDMQQTSSEKEVGEEIPKNYLSAAPNLNQNSTKNETEGKNWETTADSEDKTLCIVLDVPEKIKNKSKQSDTDSQKDNNILIDEYYCDNLFGGLKQCSEMPKTKADRLLPDVPFELSNRSKSLTRFESSTSSEPILTKSRSKMGFEVHEIEDAASYIFHLRFKKSLWQKVNPVEQVPEKEVTTRSSMAYDENVDQEQNDSAPKMIKAPIKEPNTSEKILEGMVLADKEPPPIEEEKSTVPITLNDEDITANTLDKNIKKKNISEFNIKKSQTQKPQNTDDNPSIQSLNVTNDNSFNKIKKKKTEIVDPNQTQDVFEADLPNDIIQYLDIQSEQTRSDKSRDSDKESTNIQTVDPENQPIEAERKDVYQKQPSQQGESESVQNWGNYDEREVFQPTVIDPRTIKKNIKNPYLRHQYPQTSDERQSEIYQEEEIHTDQNYIEHRNEKENEDVYKNQTEANLAVPPSEDSQISQTLTDYHKEREADEILKTYPAAENMNTQQSEITQDVDPQHNENMPYVHKQKDLEEFFRKYPSHLDNTNNRTGEIQEYDNAPSQNLIEVNKESESEDFIKTYPSPENVNIQQGEVSQEMENQPSQSVPYVNKQRDVEEFLRKYPPPPSPPQENMNTQSNEVFQDTESPPSQNLTEVNEEKETDDFYRRYPSENVKIRRSEVFHESDNQPTQNMRDTSQNIDSKHFYKNPPKAETKGELEIEPLQEGEGKPDPKFLETAKEKGDDDQYQLYPTAENMVKPPEMYLTVDAIEAESKPNTKGEPKTSEEGSEGVPLDRQQSQSPSTQPQNNVLQFQNIDEPQYAHYPYTPEQKINDLEEIPPEIPKKAPEKEPPAEKKKPRKSRSTEKKPKKPLRNVQKEKLPSDTHEKYPKYTSRYERYEPDITEFKTSADFINISFDKTINHPKYCAAFPPTLSEAFRYRGKTLGFKRDSMVNHKWSSAYDLISKDFEMNPKCLPATAESAGIFKKSVLFSKKDEKKLHCDLLLNCKKDEILHVVKPKKEESFSKMCDNIVNVNNDNVTKDQGKAPMDSLRMMKKVKEIVDFDLNNAIKIFEGRDQPAQEACAATSNGNQCKVDTKEIKQCSGTQKDKISKETDLFSCESKNEIRCDKKDLSTTREYQVPKYFPSKKGNDTSTKVEKGFVSVVRCDFDKKEFFIDQEELEKATQQQEKELFNKISTPVTKNLVKKNKGDSGVGKKSVKCQMKEGDSILVFDEENQTWKVDFSILEKRKQMKEEEELNKKSELILETFEKLENGQVSRIPKPESSDKKYFDYNKKEWKVYHVEKKSTNEKFKRAKSPFKESDAEEIRKKNSDMYEDLFSGNKKDTEINQSIKEAPGVTDLKKEGKDDVSLKREKLAESASSSTGSSSGEPPKKPEPSKPISNVTPVKKTQLERHSDAAEEDNFWEAFLKMEILPRPPPKEPVIEHKPIAQKAEKSTEKSTVKDQSQPPKPDEKPKKIEEPRFRIHIPFLGDRKSDSSKKKETPKNENKTDSPSPSPLPSQVEKTKEPEVKEPATKTPPVKAPPAGPIIYKDDTGSKPPPTIGKPSSKDTQNLSNPEASPEVKLPSTETEKKVLDTPQVQPTTPSDSSSPTKNAADHYVSENIVEITKSSKDKSTKVKSNKIETVKLNISTEKRMPSKITEINLKKKSEESASGTKKQSSTTSKKQTERKETSVENKKFYKNFEKYKTPYGDPEYEEKSVKIKLDIESNPNLKKLDNWNKTLVLHDIAKPPENIESWLKDETDKMATLLLKVLQEAATGKPKKKTSKSKSCEKLQTKDNPYDSIRKKQENNPDNFLIKVKSVNFLPSSKKVNSSEPKSKKKSEVNVSDIPVQSESTKKSPKVLDVTKVTLKDFAEPTIVKVSQLRTIDKESDLAFNTVNSVLPRDFWNSSSFLGDPTDEIPGPEIFKKVANTWKLFPIISCQLTIFALLRIFQLAKRKALDKMFNKYGPIVNIQGLLSGNVVLIYKSEHLREVFDQDVSIPVRSVFDSLDQCRREVEEKLQMTGIPMDWSNPEWSDLKKVLNDPLARGCEKFLGTAEAAGESFVNNIRRNRLEFNQDSSDLIDEIKRWSTEGLCNVLFEKSFKFLEERSVNLNWILEPEKLYLSIEEATDCLSKCERGFQAWRLISTPASVGLSEAYRNLSTILHKQLYQAELNLRNKNDILKEGNIIKSRDLTFVESMVLNDGMSVDEITCNLIDILLMGINSASSAMGFFFYDLAQNEKVKTKLFNEIKEILPKKNSRLDYDKLQSLRYLQACVKETLRLHLPVPIFYRVLQRNILLSNYIIPKGTYVVMDGKVCSMKEQIFDEPERFYPERWLTDEDWIQNSHPFMTIPFCHGPRSELARKVVEMLIWSCAAKVVRNFQIEYHFGEIEESDGFISFPNKPLKLNFIEREE